MNDLENRFSFHPANTEERRNDHEAIRTAALEFARFIADRVPPGREQSLAITHLEEVMFWANAGIARQPEPPSDPLPGLDGKKKPHLTI